MRRLGHVAAILALLALPGFLGACGDRQQNEPAKDANRESGTFEEIGEGMDETREAAEEAVEAAEETGEKMDEAASGSADGGER